MGWVMDYADPAGILDVVFNPRSAFQYTGWQSKEYTDLLAKALAEQDEKKRGELYKSAEKILLQEAAVVAPLQYYDRTVLVKTGVTFEYPSFGPPNLQYWRLP
jgi:oligopeptide transport system substrate-binding protein